MWEVVHTMCSINLDLKIGDLRALLCVPCHEDGYDVDSVKKDLLRKQQFIRNTLVNQISPRGTKQNPKLCTHHMMRARVMMLKSTRAQ